MQLRSGRCLVYPPSAQEGGRHLCQPQHNSEDRINSLPKELLLEILVRLRCVAEAVCAGAVCCGWRSLWTELPELRFWSAHPLSVRSTLARITRPSLDLLNIDLWSGWTDEGWDEHVSLLLRGAARLLPEKLIINVSLRPIECSVVDLPCFERTSYLSLQLMRIPITLPQSGKFSALNSLRLQYCRIDLCGLLSLCPCLRILNIKDVTDLRHAGTVIVHSPLLEEFSLEINDYDICRIDIVVPVLKEITLEVEIDKDFSLSFSAPMVKKLRWGCFYSYASVGFGQIWRLLSIKERELDEFHVVSLTIKSSAHPNDLLDAELSITQVIAHLPVKTFSVLELDVRIDGHTFGPMMMHLLRIQPTIQRLKVILARDKVRVTCPVNCPCEEPSNWRSEDVSLANLEVVEIHGLQGKDDEVDFLKIILRCATVLRRLTVTISDDILPSNSGCEMICSIMKECPDVECHIVASGSEGFFIHE